MYYFNEFVSRLINRHSGRVAQQREQGPRSLDPAQKTSGSVPPIRSVRAQRQASPRVDHRNR